MLDETGFASAARWYVEGFARRSGIGVNLVLPALPRLNRDVELALFRAVQEALTNVHRHSASSRVEVNVVLDAQQVCLKVQDNGKGIRPEKLHALLENSSEAGVGLAGMRERMRDLGGSLEIRSDSSGTVVIVTIPIREQAAREAARASESPAKVAVAS